MTAPLPLDSYVEINATPWAKVTNIVFQDGKPYLSGRSGDSDPSRFAFGRLTSLTRPSDWKPMSQAIQVKKSAPEA